MQSSALPKIASDLIQKVRVYADEDAFQRDDRGRPMAGFQLKPVHDELFQAAIDLKLATRLSILDWRRPADFRAAFEVEVQRAAWWPGTANASNKRDLLSLALTPASAGRLDRKWLGIRALAEKGGRSSLWHDDPALAFAPSPGVWLGRTACVGHEGLVYYLVYGHAERDWEKALVGAGLEICASGEAGYRQHFHVPGRLGG